MKFEFIAHGVFPWETVRVMMGIVCNMLFELVTLRVFLWEEVSASVGIKVVWRYN